MDDRAIVELYHRREERAIAETDKKYGGLCRSIALRLLGGVRERLDQLGVELDAKWEAVTLLADPGAEREQGARPIRRAVRRRVEEPAADLLLSERLCAGDTLCLAVEREDIVLRAEKREV